MTDNEFLCVRCARHQRTCCQRSQVYVTLGDVERINQHTGRDDFFEFREPDDPAYAELDDDPTWRKFVFDRFGRRRVLRRQPEGDCTFLGPQGCTLPPDVRPLLCRLYPFDYTDAGLRDELAEGCPLELLRPGQDLITALGMHRQKAHVWQQQLYDEIQREPIQ